MTPNKILLPINPLKKHREETKRAALSWQAIDVYNWLCVNGYFPESYVLPPCFQVDKRPQMKEFFPIKTNPAKTKNEYKPVRSECINVSLPRTEYTDRVFGLVHPEIHNDIAYHMALNWRMIVDKMIPDDSQVASYTFPMLIESSRRGRIGRSIYNFIEMERKDFLAMAYKFGYVAKTDIKSFYPSIYTHSISWAIHGKSWIRRKENRNNYTLLGNKLDKLFQSANDGCTNGIPIGPVVSDIIAEIIASAVDVVLTKNLKKARIKCEIARYKDDYRILARSKSDANKIVKILQSDLREYNLDINSEKTKILNVPDGLFREWVAKYYAFHPRVKNKYKWTEFHKLYQSVLMLDKECQGTNLINRFLSDMLKKHIGWKGQSPLRVIIAGHESEFISMLLMLAKRNINSFPKVLAIIESMLGDLSDKEKEQMVNRLEELLSLLPCKEKNQYLILWFGYFLVSNKIDQYLSSELKKFLFPPTKSLFPPTEHEDSILMTIFENESYVFNECKEFNLFVECEKTAQKITMLEHLNIFENNGNFDS